MGIIHSLASYFSSTYRSHCYCPPGLQGNPRSKCLEVGCQSDYDCDKQERCDIGSRQCVRLCLDQPCVQGAECSARNHREFCNCIPPLYGDGFVYCEKRKLDLTKIIFNIYTYNNDSSQPLRPNLNLSADLTLIVLVNSLALTESVKITVNYETPVEETLSALLKIPMTLKRQLLVFALKVLL